jgi:VanZ family protein
VLWAALISSFSTGWFSAEQTGGFLIPFLAFLFPEATPAQLRAAHVAVRKLAHFGEYLVLSVLLYRALAPGDGWSPRAAGVALALAALYGAADELHQGLLPSRTGSVADTVIDFSGALAGQGLVAAWARRR